MNPRVLFMITSDPRTSGKPAEAIRIAAGVSAWKKAKIAVYLRDSAVLALAEDCSDLMNEDNFTRYLPMLVENNVTIYAQDGNALLGELGDAAIDFKRMTDAELAKVAVGQTYVMRF